MIQCLIDWETQSTNGAKQMSHQRVTETQVRRVMQETRDWEIWHDGEWLVDVHARNGLAAEAKARSLGFNLDGLEAYPA